MASCREERDELMETKISASQNATLSNKNTKDSIRVKSLNTINSSDGDNSEATDDPTSSEGDPPPKNGQQWLN
ncbi:hypothetical protein [Elizabethkingia anophelis]|uniref:hypothetical protein n=1 Tax=Elizabethkingia anophelis TaxID=1117645 RepID=UPI00136825A1|nr:hypothetical protein [Elizabethkingia anophelis]MYY43895.1 hypothetical protein [Elizabethkingia anophelis]